MTALLPKGARIVPTAVADDRLVVTIEVGGAIEVRTFDLQDSASRRTAQIRRRALTAVR